MKPQQEKDIEIEDPSESAKNQNKFERTKITESYQSLFFRNGHDTTDRDPSQSSQNSNSRTKNRLKSTRVKSKQGGCIYYELQSTQKRDEQGLRQQNIELKKTIAELKISQFYQFDQAKLKDLLYELQQLRQELSKIQKQNERLRLENDFLNRANFQLKLQNSRLRKKHEDPHSIIMQAMPGLKQSPNKEQPTPRQQPYASGPSSPIPSHLLIGERLSRFGSSARRFQYGGQPNFEMEQHRQLRGGRDQLASLSRVKSEKMLTSRQFVPSRKVSKKKTLYTEIGRQM